MSHPEHLQHQPPFEFTELEQLSNALGHTRFLILLRDERTTIHQVELSSNSCGEFLFITLSRVQGDRGELFTFYGLGFHDYRERWITETWSWYEAMETRAVKEQRLSPEEIERVISERLAEISPHLRESTQSARGKLYELLAELTDEDGAISELEDLGDAADWFFGDEEE